MSWFDINFVFIFVTNVDWQNIFFNFWLSVFKARTYACTYRIYYIVSYNNFSTVGFYVYMSLFVFVLVWVRESNLEFDQSIFVFDRVSRSECVDIDSVTNTMDIQFCTHTNTTLYFIDHRIAAFGCAKSQFLSRYPATNRAKEENILTHINSFCSWTKFKQEERRKPARQENNIITQSLNHIINQLTAKINTSARVRIKKEKHHQTQTLSVYIQINFQAERHKKTFEIQFVVPNALPNEAHTYTHNMRRRMGFRSTQISKQASKQANMKRSIHLFATTLLRWKK